MSANAFDSKANTFHTVEESKDELEMEQSEQEKQVEKQVKRMMEMAKTVKRLKLEKERDVDHKQAAETADAEEEKIHQRTLPDGFDEQNVHDIYSDNAFNNIYDDVDDDEDDDDDDEIAAEIAAENAAEEESMGMSMDEYFALLDNGGGSERLYTILDAIEENAAIAEIEAENAAEVESTGMSMEEYFTFLDNGGGNSKRLNFILNNAIQENMADPICLCKRGTGEPCTCC